MEWDLLRNLLLVHLTYTHVMDRQPHLACVCRRLLKYLNVRGGPERALEVFNWLDNQPGYPTSDAFHYVALMSGFSRRGSKSDAAQAGPAPPLIATRALAHDMHFSPVAAGCLCTFLDRLLIMFCISQSFCLYMAIDLTMLWLCLCYL